MDCENCIIRMIRSQYEDTSNVSPVAMMYGIAQMLTMESSDLMQLINRENIAEKAKFFDDFSEAKEHVERIGLDLELIKQGTALILPFCHDNEDSGFYKALCRVTEGEGVQAIVSCVLFSLDEDYIKAFQNGHTMTDIQLYYDQLKEEADAWTFAENEPTDTGVATDLFESTATDIPENESATTENQGEVANRREQKRTIHVNFHTSDPDEALHNPEELSEEPVPEVPREIPIIYGVLLGHEWFRYLRDSLDNLVQLLTEAKREDLIDGLYQYIHAVSFDQLKAAKAEYKESQSNENFAKVRAEEHRIKHNLWAVMQEYRRMFLDSQNKLCYLSKKYAGIYQTLTHKIVGQSYAINEIVRTCFDAELYIQKKSQPQAVFLFAGPPGVGKTYLAQSVAESLERPFKVFDMAAYADSSADLILTGTETLFRNSTEGTLVSFVEEHPDAIILFDEIEKAHPDVTRLFLSILEGGRLENKFLSSNTDFSNTILIFTTNAGREVYEGTKKNLSAIPTEIIINELRKEKTSRGELKFPPELCSRFASQHIIMFNHLGISDITKLVIRHMDAACEDIEKDLGMNIDYDRRLALLFVLHFGTVDVRIVTKKAQEYIKKEIYDLSRQLAQMDESERIKKIRFSIDDLRITDKAKSFFAGTDPENTVFAVVCDEAGKNKLEDLKIENLRFEFYESEEALLECDPEEVSAYLIDPFFEMQRYDNRILGLDDYDSEGLRIIKSLIRKNVTAPIFILENGRKVSQTDKNTLYMRGVEDTISLDTDGSSEFITRIATDLFLQQKCAAMLDRRKVFDFETLQEMPDAEGTVQIRFYDIRVKDSVNAEDQALMIDIDERPNVKFADVIGAENAKDELRDFIRYLENPKAYMQRAMAVPKGILLYGPPGTGKTLLAKALAGETEATFISMSAAKLKNDGADSIERLFTTARKYAPSIIFLDEVDAIARKRTGSAYSSAYTESMLNMLLTQMDGFEQHKGAPVFVVAATNFGIKVSDDPMSGGLDPAFMRRFGNKILVDPPNKEEKIQYLTKKLLGSGRAVIHNTVSEDGIQNIAERAHGETLATLENILELAFRNAARKGRILDDELLDEAMEEYFYGEKRRMNESEMYRTAVHEAAHAYISMLSGRKPSYLTVISRGDFGGYMQTEADEHAGNLSKEDCLWAIRTSLAGREGEMVVFGDAAAMNTGASVDLRKASEIAMSMLTAYGMTEGHLYSMPVSDLLRSELMSQYVARADQLLQEQAQICHTLIEKGKDKIITLAQALLAKNHLNKREIEKLLGDSESE